MTERPPLLRLNKRITACERCPRLREHCHAAATNPRASYRGETYWGRPVPNLLPPVDPPHRDPADTVMLLLVGLAPAAHGANRTGRMFTGDRSGDFLFEAMHAAGLCNQPEGRHADDGLALLGCAVTAAAHCAPPDNKPTREELANCASHLRDTLDALPRLRSVVTLGRIAHEAWLRLYKQRGWVAALADAPFAHGAEHRFAAAGPNPTRVAPAIFCTYHPSQQNTFTGRLTQAMLRDVLRAARVHALNG